MAGLSYPATRYDPSPVVDLASKAERERLSPSALKAFFNESFVIPNPVVASDDGQSLLPYTGSDAAQITVGGELDKLANNVALGRDVAAAHWRSDAEQSLLLGEAVAISILRDQRATCNEPFSGFTFTKFDGTTITV